MALRAAGLQFASYPFDWVSSPGFGACAKMIADDFRGWLESPDDLDLIDIRRGGINKHVYRNAKTGFAFYHDFSSFRSFAENYPLVREKYLRRIARFQQLLRSSKRILAVCVELPVRPRLADAELVDIRKTLSAKMPDQTVDLLYFYVRQGVSSVEVVADGITAVGLDYRTFRDGELWHEVKADDIVTYLESHVAVTDNRSEEEKARYQSEWLRQDKARWHGRNWWETMVNRTAFRFYRKLERFLERKELVPREPPAWG